MDARRRALPRICSSDRSKECELTAFSDAWAALQSGLSAGTTIDNWTVASGLLGDQFTVVTVTPSFIGVDTPGASNLQRVPQADFELVYDNWASYIAGKTARQELRDRTRFSKYIISILHWVELQVGGVLP